MAVTPRFEAMVIGGSLTLHILYQVRKLATLTSWSLWNYLLNEHTCIQDTMLQGCHCGRGISNKELDWSHVIATTKSVPDHQNLPISYLAEWVVLGPDPINGNPVWSLSSALSGLAHSSGLTHFRLSQLIHILFTYHPLLFLAPCTPYTPNSSPYVILIDSRPLNTHLSTLNKSYIHFLINCLPTPNNNKNTSKVTTGSIPSHLDVWEHPTYSMATT